jgi:hypothetical protein
MKTKNTSKIHASIRKEVSEKSVDTLPIEKPPKNFPIVGIGASAGGLAAFEAFFSAMPANIDTDMSFVLVQHLAPDHKSILTDRVSVTPACRFLRLKMACRSKPIVHISSLRTVIWPFWTDHLVYGIQGICLPEIRKDAGLRLQ